MQSDLLETLFERLDRFPDRVAFQSITKEGDRESFSYEQIGREIKAVAGYLKAQGIGQGDHVALLMENHPRWGIAFLAAQRAGAILVPLDILHDSETIHQLVLHSESKFAICSEKQLPILADLQEKRESSIPVLVIGDSNGTYPEWDAVLDQDAAQEEAQKPMKRNLDDAAVIIYTSGTTGDPKGVVLSHRNINRNVEAILERVQINEKDRILCVLPLYHILALMVNFIIPLHSGSRVVFLDALDAQRILATFREEGITAFVCIPQFYYLMHRRILQEVNKQKFWKRFLFRRLLKLSRLINNTLGWNPGKLFFASIHKRFGRQFRLFGVGGARFDPEVARNFEDLGFSLLQAYGMTETAAVATMTWPDSPEVGSVGKALPHVEIRLNQADEQGTGEILIRGENVMKGYFKNPSATRETLDEEGWLHSGDLGFLSKKEFLYITGRRKDVIVLSSGKNIYPEEIEHFYQQKCSLIKEMCVLGLPEPGSSSEERLYAVIVPDFDQLKEERVVNAYDMIRYMMETISQSLPPHKRVRKFEIRQTPLPRTTTRKIRRFQVQKEIESGPPASGEELTQEEFQATTPAEIQVVSRLREMKPDVHIRPEMNLELDVGLDSLERVEFLSTLQDEFGVQFDELSASGLFTVQDVVNAVEEQLTENAAPDKRNRTSWRDILKKKLDEEDRQMLQERLRRRSVIEFLFVLFARINLLLFKVLFRLRYEGLENLPSGYPFMICPNHLSFLDAFAVGAPLPTRVLRRFTSLGYADYFRQGFLALPGRLARVIPVDADSHLRRSLRLAAEALRQEMVLCVFPEGERSIDGQLKSFRKGPAILATNEKVPVVPAGILGSYEAWRRGSNKIRLHPITVRYGAPLHPRADESIEDFNERLFRAVQKLVQTEQGESGRDQDSDKAESERKRLRA